MNYGHMMQALRGVLPQGRPFQGGFPQGGFPQGGGPVSINPGWNPGGQAPWAAPNPGAVLGGNTFQPQGLGQANGPVMNQPMPQGPMAHQPNGNAWGQQPNFVPPGQMRKMGRF